MNKETVYITEDISTPLDEGVKKVAFSIINHLPASSHVLTMTPAAGFSTKMRKDVLTHSIHNRFMFHFPTWRSIAKLKKLDLIYAPSASATLGSVVKLLLFYLCFQPSQTQLILCQPKTKRGIHDILLKLIRNFSILTLSYMVAEQYASFNIKYVIPEVDVDQFKPVSQTAKQALREKHGISADKDVILHVGHLTEFRNLYPLIQLVREDRYLLIVSSQSTPFANVHHDRIKAELISAGAHIIDDYLENIQEMYQLSDFYVFPVENPMGCIGVPLSILEALACGIQVVTTDFNHIKHLEEVFAGLSVTETTHFSTVIDQLNSNAVTDTRLVRTMQPNDPMFLHNNLIARDFRE